jgi:hypothetical protein
MQSAMLGVLLSPNLVNKYTFYITTVLKNWHSKIQTILGKLAVAKMGFVQTVNLTYRLRMEVCWLCLV